MTLRNANKFETKKNEGKYRLDCNNNFQDTNRQSNYYQSKLKFCRISSTFKFFLRLSKYGYLLPLNKGSAMDIDRYFENCNILIFVNKQSNETNRIFYFVVLVIINYIINPFGNQT